MTPRERFHLWRLMQTTLEGWRKHDGQMLAAAMAYYAALSFFPLLLVLISGLGFFLQLTDAGRNSKEALLSFVGEYSSSALKQDITALLESVETKAVIGGPLGIVTLLLTGMVLFAQFDRALDRIWEREPKESGGIFGALNETLFHRLRALCMLLGIGALLLTNLAVGLAISAIEAFASDVLPAGDWVLLPANIATSLAISTLAFTSIYKLLPRKPVPWSAALSGGATVAVVWEIGRQVLAIFLISKRITAYGIVGSFLAVMLWIYFAASLLFLGAEFVQVLCRMRESAPTGRRS